MNPNLIFINLLIDSLWSDGNFLEKIFDVKSPNVSNLARINEYLGQYFANDGDYVICPEKPLQKIRDFQESYLNFSSVNWVYVHSALNQVQNFSTEVAKQIHDKTLGGAVLAGNSPLENLLLQTLNISTSGYGCDSNLVKKLNQKDYLLEISQKLKIQVPESEVISVDKISNSNHLYKSLISSGGSGVYSYQDMERIKMWAQRKGLSSDWDRSMWLKQEMLNRAQDFNCFGSTESDRFQTVKIKYDRNRLSYQHDFDFEIDSKIADELKQSFMKVKNHLVEQGYSGPFGFDSVVTTDKRIFSVLDLNVRLNKSHVLRQVMQRFKVRKLYTSFYRLRFINSEWTSFEVFWRFLQESTNINGDRDSFLFPIDASFWNEGKSECLIALSTDNKVLKERIDQWVFRFLTNHGGQPND